MMTSLWPYLFYLPVFILSVSLYFYLRQLSESKNKNFLRSQTEAGLTEPSSLHPLIDEALCIGCAACVKACPEQNVLGLINMKAALIGPTHCIGHGACKVSCPVGAISLVFGTEKRGVDIPLVHPDFETNVPGIYIAGELGGMGLIRNAIEQGRQAMVTITKRVKDKAKPAECFHVAIIGAGPAGFSASLAAKESGLSYLTLEQETLGGTVAHYPRGKIVMTQPVDLPMFGKMQFKETTKENLLRFWQDLEARSGVQIRYSERLEQLQANDGVFTLTTQKGSYRAMAVLLSVGRRGTPRKLGVPGEEKEKVVYRLIEAEQYADRRVLVVGGGDSALEAALSVAKVNGTTVTLSYRGESFGRVKQKNSQGLEEARGQGRLHLMLNSNVREIKDATVVLEQEGKINELANDYVIVCAGGVLPTAFLKSIGVDVETKFGKA